MSNGTRSVNVAVVLNVSWYRGDVHLPRVIRMGPLRCEGCMTSCSNARRLRDLGNGRCMAGIRSRPIVARDVEFSQATDDQSSSSRRNAASSCSAVLTPVSTRRAAALSASVTVPPARRTPAVANCTDSSIPREAVRVLILCAVVMLPIPSRAIRSIASAILRIHDLIFAVQGTFFGIDTFGACRGCTAANGFWSALPPAET